MQKAKAFSFFVRRKHTLKHMISLYMYLNYYKKKLLCIRTCMIITYMLKLQ